MRADYTRFIDRMINRYEGGYCWDKGDPGGPTKYGITCYDLAEHRGQSMSSMSAWAPIVQAMSLSEAEDIYRTKYAVGVRFDDLPAGVDCTMLDYGVNSGIARPVRVARALLNVGTGDRLTDNLVEAINKADPKWFIESMCAERLHFMHAIRNGTAWDEFGKGWGARVNDLQVYSEHLLAGTAAPPAPDLSHVPTPKAQHKANTSHHTAAGAGGAATIGSAAHVAGLPVWAVAALVTAGVAGAVVFAVYEQRRAVAANARVILPSTVKPRP